MSLSFLTRQQTKEKWHHVTELIGKFYRTKNMYDKNNQEKERNHTGEKQRLISVENFQTK